MGFALAAVHGIVIQLKADRYRQRARARDGFHVYLPETNHAVQAETVSGPEMSAAGSETIVVVEDEDAVRAFVKTVLERFGYRVLDAPDAESALTLVGTVTGRIDLLLTDVILPKMDGLELARRVTKDRLALPVLFMSGYTEQMANAGVPRTTPRAAGETVTLNHLQRYAMLDAAPPLLIHDRRYLQNCHHAFGLRSAARSIMIKM